MAGSVTRIIGIGNRLMEDDGVGIAILELLEKKHLPAGVELIDGGCGGLNLLQLLEDCQRAIIIDAADFSAPPGTIRCLQNPDLIPWAWEQPIRLSHHQGLQEVLLLADKLDQLPPLTLVLVQIESCRPHLQLSARVSATLPELVHVILQEISHSDFPGPARIRSQL